MPLVEQELSTLPEPLNSPPVLNRVRATRSLVVCVFFADFYLSFCPFSFVHCVVCHSVLYGFWLPLWYLHTFILARSDLAQGVVYLIRTIIYVKCVSNLHQISTFLRIYHSITLRLLQIPISEVLCDMKTISWGSMSENDHRGFMSDEEHDGPMSQYESQI